MDTMKKLYAILIVLIVIYAGINLAYNGLDMLNGLSNVNLSIGGGDDENSIIVGSSSFDRIDGFSESKINDSAVSVEDSNGLKISVEEIDNSLDLEYTVSNLINSSTSITSNQTISQSSVTAYFLYEESPEMYNADIYFNKNSKNYLIQGNNISYGNSDHFINNCKEIINTIGESDNINYSRW